MIKGIIHIGGTKCGSSALQTALSEHPLMSPIEGPTAEAASVEYAAVLFTGDVLSGSELVKSAKTTPHGYHASVSAKILSGLPPKKIREIRRLLSANSGSNSRVLLSNEGWLGEADIFKDRRLLIKMGLFCDVVVYVRPPVEWINSSWWQWGAWTENSIYKWIDRSIDKVKWYDRINRWFNIEGVKSICVRLLPNDIIFDFCKLINVLPIPSNRSNSGLPETVLRLYQRHADLRPIAHRSAMDFSLARHLNNAESVPWVLGPKAINRIIKSTYESNKHLIDLLDEQSREILNRDRRWWDPSFYEMKKRQPLVVGHLDIKKLETLAVDALRAIHRLDEENRKLRSRANGK